MLTPSTTPLDPRSAQPMEHRLTHLLRPRSVALVGASDRSNWSNRIYDALQVIGYDGDVYLVNPRGGQAHGRTLHRSVGDIDAVPDVAFVMVPGPAVLGASTAWAQADTTRRTAASKAAGAKRPSATLRSRAAARAFPARWMSVSSETAFPAGKASAAATSRVAASRVWASSRWFKNTIT